MLSSKSDNKCNVIKDKYDVIKQRVELLKKIKILNDIRHEFKKKRFILDEGKEKFGMDEMSQLTKVKNISEIKGYPFKISKKNLILSHNIKLAAKIVPVESKYNKNEHPCHLEHIILKQLTTELINTNISPHITYYLGTQKVSNKCRALKQINLKRLELEDKIRTHSNLLLSEYVEGGSLDNWIFNTYENDEEISDIQWKYIVFQLIYTLAIIQHYYKMMHNDFHYGNILIDNTIKPSGYFVYEINKTLYYIKNTGIIPKIWDFEFSMVYSNKIQDAYPNKFIIGSYTYDRKLHQTILTEQELKENERQNVPYNYNEVYDLHYFLTSLLDLHISDELFDWILQLYPEEVIPDQDTSSSSSDSLLSNLSNITFSKSDNESDSDSSYSDSDSDTDTSHSNCSDDSENDNPYLNDDRLINGAETQFNLPNPLTLLKNKFFESLTKKPEDFNESTAIYFKAGF